MKIYLPDEVSDNDCVQITDDQFFRVIHKDSYNGDSVSYSLYFPELSYIKQEGYIVGDSYDPAELICITSSEFTTSTFYRLDMPEICLYFGVLFAIIILFFTFICKCFFKGWFK